MRGLSLGKWLASCPSLAVEVFSLCSSLMTACFDRLVISEDAITATDVCTEYNIEI